MVGAKIEEMGGGGKMSPNAMCLDFYRKKTFFAPGDYEDIFSDSAMGIRSGFAY